MLYVFFIYPALSLKNHSCTPAGIKQDPVAFLHPEGDRSRKVLKLRLYHISLQRICYLLFNYMMDVWDFDIALNIRTLFM